MNLVSVYGWKTEDDFYVDDCSQTEKHIDTLSMEGISSVMTLIPFLSLSIEIVTLTLFA